VFLLALGAFLVGIIASVGSKPGSVVDGSGRKEDLDLSLSLSRENNIGRGSESPRARHWFRGHSSQKRLPSPGGPEEQSKVPDPQGCCEDMEPSLGGKVSQETSDETPWLGSKPPEKTANPRR
jgi:hypothetical protein